MSLLQAGGGEEGGPGECEHPAQPRPRQRGAGGRGGLAAGGGHPRHAQPLRPRPRHRGPHPRAAGAPLQGRGRHQPPPAPGDRSLAAPLPQFRACVNFNFK